MKCAGTRMLSAIMVTTAAALALNLSGCFGTGPILSPCLFCGGGSSRHYVYTANAAGSPSTVSALASNANSGALTPITGSPYDTGTGSYAIAPDPLYRFLYVTNAFSSDISGFKINSANGSLTSVGSPFSAESGMDGVAIDPSGQFLYAVTGNSQNLWAYSIDQSTGTLTALAPTPVAIAPPGNNSSSAVIDPSGKYLFVTTETNLTAHLYGFLRDTTTGALTVLGGYPVALDGFANKAIFDRSGNFLLVTGTGVFGTNGGIDVFRLNSVTGTLSMIGSPVQVGGDPAGLVADFSGRYIYVANTADVTISAFALNSTTGALSAMGSPVSSGGKGSINGPLGIATDNRGLFVYVCNASNDVSVFAIDSSTGLLSPVAGSPFPDGGNAPSAIVFVP